MMYCEVIYCSCLYVYKLEEIFTTAEENEAVVSLFCGLGISLKDEICIETEVNLWEKKRTANIFENCTCQQVNKAKDNTDTQCSPR